MNRTQKSLKNLITLGKEDFHWKLAIETCFSLLTQKFSLSWNRNQVGLSFHGCQNNSIVYESEKLGHSIHTLWKWGMKLSLSSLHVRNQHNLGSNIFWSRITISYNFLFHTIPFYLKSFQTQPMNKKMGIERHQDGLPNEMHFSN